MRCLAASFAAVLVLGVLSACSSSGAGTTDTPGDPARGEATVRGKLGDRELGNAFSVAVGTGKADILENGRHVSRLTLNVMDHRADCPATLANRQVKGSTYLTFTAVRQTLTYFPIAGGNLGVGGSLDANSDGEVNYVTAAFGALSDQCKKENPSVADSGTLTITEMGNDHVKGNFEIFFRGGERLTGEFDAPFCGEDVTGAGTCE